MEKMVEIGEAEETAGSRLGRRAEQQEQAIERFHEKAGKAQNIATMITENWEHVNSSSYKSGKLWNKKDGMVYALLSKVLNGYNQ